MTNTRSLQRKLYNERGGAQLLTPTINLACIVGLYVTECIAYAVKQQCVVNRQAYSRRNVVLIHTITTTIIIIIDLLCPWAP